MKLTLLLIEGLDALRHKTDGMCLKGEIFTTRRNQYDEESFNGFLSAME
jgi:hypothetical protein